MSRPLRVLVKDGWYHVTSRGVDRRAIFEAARDEARFLALLAELPERYGVRVAAYVLMGNHYHLIVQTPQANLTDAMQWLNVSYSIWFNRRRRRVGPLFQGRFKAILLEDEGARLFAVAEYVHLNPVRVAALGLGKATRGAERAGLLPTPRPEEVARRLKVLRAHRGSSYLAYAGYAATPPWLSTGEILGRAPGRGRDLARRYREAVESTVRRGMAESPWHELRSRLVLGTEAFWRSLRAQGDRAEMTELRMLERRTRWEDVVRTVEAIKGEPWAAFRDRYGDRGRDLVLAAARRRCGMTLAELGEAAGGLRYAAVSQAIRTLEARLRRDRRCREEWKAVNDALNT